MTAPIVALIVAVAENGVIGRDGKLPWRIPEDMKWFKARTAGRPLIMGRKTWESFPKRPLPGRTNIVVTRDAAYRAEGGVVVAFAWMPRSMSPRGEAPEEIMVIGGAEIYRAALPLARPHLSDQRARRDCGRHAFPGDRSRRNGWRRSSAFIPRQRSGRSATVSSSWIRNERQRHVRS